MKVRDYRYEIRAIPGALDKLRGKLNEGEFAERTGIDRTHMWKVKSGVIRPGNIFMAKIFVAYPKAKFHKLFEVVEVEDWDVCF